MKKLFTCFFLVFTFLVQAQAQTVTTTGKVTSAVSKAPLSGVSVLVKGTTNGTTTNAEGIYSINVPSTSGSTLVFSFVGHSALEVPVNGRTFIDVTLEEGTNALTDIVVVAYGTQKKTTVTGAVGEIKGTELTRRPVSSIGQALQGQLPGLTVLDRGGAPGDPGTFLRIRGLTTLGDNSPLTLVDGVEQRIWDVNPNDIETITVLKDASSTAIYGSRAANGVILVTTKRGREGAVAVAFNSTASIQRTINHPKAMDTKSYMELQAVAAANSNRTTIFTPQYIADYMTNMKTDPLRYPAAMPNWFDIIYSPAPQYDVNLAVSGGSKNSTTRASIRYQDQQGLLPSVVSGFKLYDLRVNNNFRIGSRINVNADASYRRTTTSLPWNEFNVYAYTLHGGSIWTVPKFPNGTYGLGTRGNNPLMYAEQAGSRRFTNNLINGNIKGEINIINGLKFSSQFGVKSAFNMLKGFANAYTVTDYFNPTTVLKTVGPNQLVEERGDDILYTITNLLTYETKINSNHAVNALLGYNQIGQKITSLGGTRQNFYNNNIQSLSAGTNDNTRTNYGGDVEFGLRSYFSRINYNYKEKYLLEANGRYDGSSNFSSKNRYAFFPSFSAGWRLSQEDFWEPLSNTISEFKVRASWGETGNQAIPAYEFNPSLTLRNYSFNGLAAQGYILNNFINQDLTWEKTTQTDVAVDMQLFNNKLSVTAEYYNKRTDGILLVLGIPATIGQNPSYQNAGVVENKGWEFQARYNGIAGQLRYFVSGNFTINKNKVLDLAGTGPYLTHSGLANGNPIFIRKEGLPIDAHWGYLTDGLFQTHDELANYPKVAANTSLGDVKYVDLNGDGKITPDDMTYLGNVFPEQTFGLNTGLRFKNLELNLLFQGAAKVKTRLSGAIIEQGAFEGFVHENFTNNYWTPENTTSKNPRPLLGTLQNYYASDRNLINGAYVRLKTVQLVYSLPQGMVQRLRIKGLSFSLAATNLLTISGLNKWQLDPEIYSGRLGEHPQTSLTTFGVNVQF